MKKTCLTGLTIAALMLLSIVNAGAQRNTQAESMMAAARQKEMVEGDQNAAIKQYKQIVDRFSKTAPDTAAMALVRMAEAYRRLGDSQSRQILERVIREYGDEKEAVALARARLSGDSSSEPIARTVYVTPNRTFVSGTVSRDGRVFSYRQDGDLFIHEIGTGADRNITKRPSGSNVFEPVISPDGKQIAYVWKTQDNRYSVRLTNLTGNPNSRVLYEDVDVFDLYLKDWSPDGKWLALELHRADKVTKQIALLSVSDPKARVLKSLDWRDIGRMYFSPDGKYLGYERAQDDTSSENDVFVLAVDASREFPAVTHRSNDTLVGWSPDGRWLLFHSDRTGTADLWAVSFADGNTRGEPQRVKANLGNFRPMGWTSSGALYYQTNQISERISNLRLASFDFKEARYFSEPLGTRGYLENTGQPVWSPDGKNLAYVSQLRGGGGEEFVLVIRTAETGKTRELRPPQLTKDGLVSLLGWSPDGRNLWVIANRITGVQQTVRSGLYRVDAETGDASSANVPFDPDKITILLNRWRPDGLSFQITAAGPAGRTTYQVDAQSGNMTLAGPDEVNIGFTLSKDKTIGYYRQNIPSTGEGAPTSFAFIERNLVTGQERELIRRSFLGAINLSPDGQYIATASTDAESNSRVMLLIPTAGGETRELMRVPSEVTPEELNAQNPGQRISVAQWAPDSQSLLLIVRGPTIRVALRQVPSDRTKEVELWVVRVKSGELEKVVGNDKVPTEAQVLASPDAQRFVYNIEEPAPPATSEVAILENFLPTPLK